MTNNHLIYTHTHIHTYAYIMWFCSTHWYDPLFYPPVHTFNVLVTVDTTMTHRSSDSLTSTCRRSLKQSNLSIPSSAPTGEEHKIVSLLQSTSSTDLPKASGRLRDDLATSHCINDTQGSLSFCTCSRVDEQGLLFQHSSSSNSNCTFCVRDSIQRSVTRNFSRGDHPGHMHVDSVGTSDSPTAFTSSHMGASLQSLPVPIARSCREEAAAGMNHLDDTTVEDLAGYLDQIMFIPKPMSEMAELMYT